MDFAWICGTSTRFLSFLLVRLAWNLVAVLFSTLELLWRELLPRWTTSNLGLLTLVFWLEIRESSMEISSFIISWRHWYYSRFWGLFDKKQILYLILLHLPLLNHPCQLEEPGFLIFLGRFPLQLKLQTWRFLEEFLPKLRVWCFRKKKPFSSWFSPHVFLLATCLSKSR